MGPKIIVVVIMFCFGINSALAQSCKDMLNYCNSWPDSYCQDYKDYMKKNCVKRCGYCSGPTTRPVCEDKQPERYCQSWKRSGYCNSDNQYYNYMKENCRKTCGFCGTVTTEPATTKPATTQPNTKPTEFGSCSSSNKLRSCSFDSDTCDFVDVPFGDDLNFALKSSGGQDGGGYISASGRGEAQLILPLELLVPHNGDHGNMCMEFYYKISSSRGSLEVHEVENARSYPRTTKISLSGLQRWWGKAKITFRAAQFKHLLIQASPNTGSVDIDSVRFCDGSCN